MQHVGILSRKDRGEFTIRRALGWNGCLQSSDNHQDSCPSDAEFEAHFQALFCAGCHIALNTDRPDDSHFIPLLGATSTPQEIDSAICSKKNKAFIGVCAGLFQWLPVPWMLFLANFFNSIFTFSLDITDHDSWIHSVPLVWYWNLFIIPNMIALTLPSFSWLSVKKGYENGFEPLLVKHRHISPSRFVFIGSFPSQYFTCL